MKRGKPDGVTRSRGEAAEKEGKGGGEGRKKRGRKRREGERKRGARLEFARFIPPPVFKLRPDDFPSPASLSALLFLLVPLVSIVLCRHLAIQPSKQQIRTTL